MSNLVKNIDEKTQTYRDLKEKLDKKIYDADNLAIEKSKIFNELENYKYQNHQKFILMQEKFNQKETTREEKISQLTCKCNRLQEEIEKNKMSTKIKISEEKLF
jgi:hypothetical protein